MERRLPVWREEYRSFSRSFRKPFVLDTFQAICIIFFKHVQQTHEDEHRRDETSGCVGEQNLSFPP